VANVRIGAEWYDALERYVDGLASAAQLAGSRATEYLEEQTEARAREDGQWSELADHIETWSEDGRLYIGVIDEAYVSRAFNIEYGDSSDAPNSLFRTMTPTAEGMTKVMDDTFRERYGGAY